MPARRVGSHQGFGCNLVRFTLGIEEPNNQICVKTLLVFEQKVNGFTKVRIDDFRDHSHLKKNLELNSWFDHNEKILYY